MELSSNQVRTKQLGHLGLVAATIHELGLIDKIDARLSLDKRKGGMLSHGRRVAAMVLNGLGFVNSRLYLSPMFFHDKPISALLGEEISVEPINDDCLGRCLDKISEYGTTKLLSEIAFEIAQEQGALSGHLHLDTTSLTLYGDYPQASKEGDGPLPCLGYSKAHRADLKQVVLSMVQAGPAHLPLWMEALSGNSSDKVSFHETARRIQAFYEALQSAPEGLCLIMDSAFYHEEKLRELPVNWITRVPMLSKEAKAYYHQTNDAYRWSTSSDSRYQIAEIVSCHASQRWILVASEPGYQREYQTLCKRMTQTYATLEKQVWHLGHHLFGCEQDATLALQKLNKQLKYFEVMGEIMKVPYYAHQGRPQKGTPPQGYHYTISATIVSCLDKVGAEMNKLGRFILATNILDPKVIENEAILRQYKEQTQVESGFKFIKNDTFELDNVFLKNQNRIGALMMIMTVCLIVYNFAQYKLRQYLKENNDYLPNQLGKPIQNPTMQWIFAIMASIAVVEIKPHEPSQWIVTNIHPLHQKIISIFGDYAKKIYGVPIELQPEDIILNQKNWLTWCGM